MNWVAVRIVLRSSNGAMHSFFEVATGALGDAGMFRIPLLIRSRFPSMINMTHPHITFGAEF
jgi:hypothetical protein